jgi:hypothetical protein
VYALPVSSLSREGERRSIGSETFFAGLSGENLGELIAVARNPRLVGVVIA